MSGSIAWWPSSGCAASTPTPRSSRALLREARVAAAISHPNICQVYELAEERGELFVVMELLTGETLADRIGRGSLPLGEALQTTWASSAPWRRCTPGESSIAISSRRTSS